MADRNINIDINLDGSDSVKTVGQLKNEMKGATNEAKSLKAQLREMTNQLAELEPGTEEFKRLSAEAGRLRDQIADTNAVINATAGNLTENLGKGLGNIAKIGIAGFQGVEGAMAMFGVETENAQKAMAVLQGSMAFTQAIETFGGLSDKITEIKASFMGLTKGIEGATIAQKALNLISNANPLILMATALTTVVAGMALFADRSNEVTKSEKKRAEETKKANDELKRENNEVAKSSAGFVSLIYQLKSTNINSKERLKLIGDINKQYGTTIKNIQDEKKFQEQLNGEIKSYIEYQRVKFKLTRNQDLIEKGLAKEEELQKKINAAYKEAKDLVKSGARKSIEDALSYREDLRKTIQEGERDLKALQKRLEGYGANLGSLKTKEDELTDSGNKYVETVQDTTDKTNELTAAQKAQMAALERSNEFLVEKEKAESDYLDSTLSKRTQEENAVRDKYFYLIEKSKEYGLDSTLLEKARDAELKVIGDKYEKDEKDRLDRIAETNRKWREAEAQQEEDFLDLYERATMDSKELEIRDVNDKYFELVTLAEQHHLDTKALKEKQAAEIAEINKKYGGKELEDDKRINSLKIQGIQDTLSTISNLAELFAGKSKESQKKAFELQKAVSISSALISTYKSANEAYASLAEIPVVGPALGAAAAAAAVTAGLLNVKKIASQKFESPGDTSPGGGGNPPSGSSFNPSTFYNLGNGGPQSNNNTSGGGTKVYVLEKDISHIQRKVSVIERRSVLGN